MLAAKKSFLQKSALVFFSLFITLAAVETTLQLAGKLYLKWQNPQRHSRFSAENETRIMCIGESTTAIGFGDSYPATLERMLNQKFPHRNFVVINEGVSGTTTRDILATLESKLNKYRPHMVISMMGINDYWYLVLRAVGSSVEEGKLPFYKKFKLYKVFAYFKINLENRQQITKKYEEELQRQRWAENVHDPSSHYNLALWHIERKDYRKAEKELMTSVQLGGAHSEIFWQTMGMVALNLGKYQEAQDYFDRYLGDKNSPDKLAELIKTIFNDEKKFHTDILLKYLAKSIQQNENLGVKINSLRILIYIYTQIPERADFTVAKKYYDELYQIHLHDIVSLQYLSEQMMKERQPKMAEFYLRRGLDKIDIKLDPNSAWVDKKILWSFLVNALDLQERHQEAAQLEKQITQDYPGYPVFRIAIVPKNYYQQIKNKHRPSAASGDTSHLEVTEKNYRKIVEMIKDHGSQPVAMEYANREVAPLKKMLEGISGVIFIDNNQTFKEKLKTMDFEELFTDHFGGDTGHFTPLGAQLVAGQIINTLEQHGIFSLASVTGINP